MINGRAVGKGEKEMQKGRFPLYVVLLLLILLAGKAYGKLPQWNLTELCQKAEWIATGEIETISQTADCTFIIFRPVELFKGDSIGPKAKVRVVRNPAGNSSVFADGNFVLLFLNFSESERTFELCDPLQGVYLLNAGRALRSASGPTVPWATLTSEVRRITRVAKPTGVELSVWGKIKELFR